jgi:two-component system, chemotaxis family, response regulator Rcp1
MIRETPLPKVLLVEDNPLDIMMTRKALEEGDFRFKLHVAEDGEQALDFLYQNCNSTNGNTSCPDLILLDLNLPKRTGKEVLAEIRQHPNTRFIPVIILTTSAEEKDIVECYSQSANCYVTKPLNVDNFKEAIQGIGKFWTEVAKLPQKPN